MMLISSEEQLGYIIAVILIRFEMDANEMNQNKKQAKKYRGFSVSFSFK